MPDGIFQGDLPREAGDLCHGAASHCPDTKRGQSGNRLKKYIDVLATNAVNFEYRVSDMPSYIRSVHTLDNVLRGAKEYLLVEPDYEHFRFMTSVTVLS